ncbi:MAG: cobyrinate a,c-diamide synthase [Synergistaceae bacterium]|nr:cobyrinate a,c-diamide synthase [Synergistaceae bacterium]
MKRIVIAGASSRSGKTTAACALLASLRKRGLTVSAYKTGPDYIDREHLSMAGQCQAYNLDTWLMSEERMTELFAFTSAGRDIAIIEGAMGLYDGGINSTAEISRLLDAPVILVVNARSMGESAAAVALGFREYDRRVNLAGVILNFTGSDYHEEIIAEALREKGIKFLGALRRDDGFVIPERHLGLVQAGEISGFDTGRLAAMFESSVDVDGVLRLADVDGESRCPETLVPHTKMGYRGGKPAECDIFPAKKYDVRVGVAQDEAFTFVYPESLLTLSAMGAEIVPFSPLRDECLPNADGYIFCGGYPEIFAEGLAANATMLDSVRQCRKPVLAECGGMMYLCRTLRDSEGRCWDMAGVIPFTSYMAGRSVMGYRTGVAIRDNILCRKGESLRGHEYHYSRIEPEYRGDSCAFELSRRDGGGTHIDGYAHGNILASYLHTNFFGSVRLAERFLDVLTSSRV